MKKWTNEAIIKAIQHYYLDTQKIPKQRDFRNNKDYPGYMTVINAFGSWNIAITSAGFIPVNKTPNSPFIDCSEIGIIKAIQDFYNDYKRIPNTKDFTNNSKYPSVTTVQKVFGSWNKAIETAGFSTSIQNGFGIRTYGLDGYLYRSQVEAYFADNYLFNKFEYKIEPKYPEPYDKWYDWYLPTKNLYIELDGGLRPKVTKEKIEINKLLNRDCLFINTKRIISANKLIANHNPSG